MVTLYLVLAVSLGLAVTGSIAYLLLLLAAAALAKRSQRRAADALPEPTPLPRMTIVIPAHDEELVLAATLCSLDAQEYPRDRFDVVVVADNCTDTTAEIGRKHGARVLERVDPIRRGKGHALDWAFEQLLALPAPADAFVIVDADTWIAPDFLGQMASRLVTKQDKHGCCALQGRYGVLNREESWRAALMAAAFDLCNHVKLLGQAQLGLSVGLKGNGMAFTRPVLERARWRGDSITEDIDYGLDLLRHHGIVVGYVSEAVVQAQMPTNAGASATQRERWESGRYRLARERGIPLLAEGLKRQNVRLCEAAIGLLVLPLAELTGLLALWGGVIVLGQSLHLLPEAIWSDCAWVAAATGLGAYVVAGLGVSDAPAATYGALLRAPGYAIWKFTRYAARLVRRPSRSGGGAPEWVRTARAPLAPPSDQPSPVPPGGGRPG